MTCLKMHLQMNYKLKLMCYSSDIESLTSSETLNITLTIILFFLCCLLNELLIQSVRIAIFGA